MNSIGFFKDSIQIGPWRIARKHLLFIVLFCIILISFGLVILHTKAFDGDDEEEDGDEENDEKHFFGENFRVGDWLMFTVMILAGLMAIIAISTCLFVGKNTPSRLSDNPGSQSVYSVQFNNNDAKINSEALAQHNLAYCSAGNSPQPQAAHAQNHIRNGEYPMSSNHRSSPHHFPQPLSVKGLTDAVASAPQFDHHDNPPPYSP